MTRHFYDSVIMILTVEQYAGVAERAGTGRKKSRLAEYLDRRRYSLILTANYARQIRWNKKRFGRFLKKLDTLITLHQRKLEKLQNIKKSCLEKMFV